jgi:hypothetical protein
MHVDRGRSRAAPARHAAAALACGALAACGCPSFAASLAEFDSVAGWRANLAEPVRVEYQVTAERLPLLVRTVEGTGIDLLMTEVFGVAAAPTELDNPAEFARDRIDCMIGEAAGDLHRSALLGVRLVWVIEGDEQPLNQALAVDGVGRLLDGLGASPLGDDRPRATSDDQAVLSWHPRAALLRRALARLLAARASPLSAEEREALIAVADLPPPTPRDGREMVLVLNALARRSGARDRQVIRSVLQRVLVRALVDALERAVYEARVPLVRETAIRTCCRLRGRDAVPRLLRVMTAARAARSKRPAGRDPGVELNPYDQDPGVRLLLVRMSAQLPAAEALAARQGGVPVVEFLYDVIADVNSERGLQAAALEALALCLGRTVSLDRAWADEWYATYVAQRSGAP